MKNTRLTLLALALLTSTPAFAQTADNDQVMERMDRLEHDVQLLQKQLSNGAAVSGGAAAPAGSAAELEVRLSGIEDQMRTLRGQLEENQFQVRKVAEALDKLAHDTDFRFNELSKAPPVAAPAAANTPAALPAPTNGPTTAGDGMLHPPANDAGNPPDQGNKTDFATPKDHYNYAFRLLGQTQYPEAAASFEAFIKKYPKDPLVGNAWYWEGETYYIRRDYVTAADDFRQGFEAIPDGPKAPDNLFKLAMSLDALNRDKDACVVLSQVVLKFKKSAIAVRADQESKRIGCK